MRNLLTISILFLITINLCPISAQNIPSKINTENKLINAVFMKDLKLTNRLIKQGANVNSTTDEGITALMCTAINGNREIAKLLIKKGAKVNTRANNGMTALNMTAVTGQVDLAKLLIKHGAKVDDKSTGGTYALKTVAQERGHTDYVNFIYSEEKRIIGKKRRKGILLVCGGLLTSVAGLVMTSQEDVYLSGTGALIALGGLYPFGKGLQYLRNYKYPNYSLLDGYQKYYNLVSIQLKL